MTKAVLHIDMDKPCTICGEKGATPSGLCLKCVTKNLEKIGRNQMPEVKVELKKIEDLKISSKEDKDRGHLIQVSFLTQMPPVEIARLMHIHYAGHGLTAVIASPQASFDLKLEKVDLASGEVSKI